MNKPLPFKLYMEFSPHLQTLTTQFKRPIQSPGKLINPTNPFLYRPNEHIFCANNAMSKLLTTLSCFYICCTRNHTGHTHVLVHTSWNPSSNIYTPTATQPFRLENNQFTRRCRLTRRSCDFTPGKQQQRNRGEIDWTKSYSDGVQPFPPAGQSRLSNMLSPPSSCLPSFINKLYWVGKWALLHSNPIKSLRTKKRWAREEH